MTNGASAVAGMLAAHEGGVIFGVRMGAKAAVREAFWMAGKGPRPIIHRDARPAVSPISPSNPSPTDCLRFSPGPTGPGMSQRRLLSRPPFRHPRPETRR